METDHTDGVADSTPESRHVHHTKRVFPNPLPVLSLTVLQWRWQVPWSPQWALPVLWVWSSPRATAASLGHPSQIICIHRMLSPCRVLRAPTLIVHLPRGPRTCCWIQVCVFSTLHCRSKGTAISRKPQGEVCGDSYWLGLQLLSAVSQRPANSPVLIMFAYCCLSVVPVCFYSHPSAQLRIVVLSWESLCSGVGFWFGHHLNSRQGEKSKKNAWFTEHCEGCCEG